MFQKIILIWSLHSQKFDIDVQALICLEGLEYFQKNSVKQSNSFPCNSYSALQLCLMIYLNLTTDTAIVPCLQAYFNVVTLKKPQGKHQI